MRYVLVFIYGLIILSSITFSTYAGLSGSAHDFGATEDVCKQCHINGFGGSADDLDIPIIDWTFEVYQSPTMDATPGQPRGVSLLCLGCHDGVTAPGDYNLSNDHPISFLYGESASKDPFIKDDMTELPLYEGYLECATCHEPHNLLENPFLLRKSNAQSALCFTCHNK